MKPQQRGGNNNRERRADKPVSEFKDQVLEVRRVSRVMAGGKRFTFRAAVVVGDYKGRVGLGIAKGLDFASSVQKAKRQAEKDLIKVPLVNGRTIPHDVEAKFDAAWVRIKPAREGHGLIAGGSCRSVLELAGVKDISAKILSRTKNKIANARATLKALEILNTTVRRVNLEIKQK
jgi:small subunit ribosomal protein S5